MLEDLSRTTRSPRHRADRTRLIERLAAGTPSLSNRRVAVCGQHADFVAGIVSLLLEAGMQPVLCASAAPATELARTLNSMTPELSHRTMVLQAEDFVDLEWDVVAAKPEILVASRQGCQFARQRQLPFLCAGQPMCDSRLGPSVLHVGYCGALQILRRLENALKPS
jgi:nitrogenase molybdenum-iron protein NifN